MSMDVKNTGALGFTYTRAFADVEARVVGENGKGGKTGQMGCRIYDKDALNKASQNASKGNFLNAIKAKILLMVGKEVEIDGKKCIVGRTSFKELISRLNKANPKLGLSEKNFQETMTKLSGLQVTFARDPGIDPKNVKNISDQINVNKEVASSPLSKKLSSELLKVAARPNDDSSVRGLEQVVEDGAQPERTITQPLAASRSQSKSDMSRPASPARSVSSESPVRAGLDRETARKELAAMRTGKNAGHIEWDRKGTAKLALNEIFNQVKGDPVKKNEFLRKLEIAGFELNKKGDAVK